VFFTHHPLSKQSSGGIIYLSIRETSCNADTFICSHGVSI